MAMEAARVGMTDHNILAVAMESPSVTARQKGKAYQFIGGCSRHGSGDHVGSMVIEPVWVRAVMLCAELAARGTVTRIVPTPVLAWTAYATPPGSRRKIDPMLVTAATVTGAAEKERSMLPTLVFSVAVAEDRSEPLIDPAFSRTWTAPDSDLRAMPPAPVRALT